MLGLGGKKYFLFYIIGFLYSSSLFSMEQEYHFEEELEQSSELDHSVRGNKTLIRKEIRKKSSLLNSFNPQKKSTDQREGQESNLEKDSKKIEEWNNDEEIRSFPQKPTVSKESYLPSVGQLSPQTQKQLSNSKTQQNTPQKIFPNNEEDSERKQLHVQRNLFQGFNQKIENLPSENQEEGLFQDRKTEEIRYFPENLPLQFPGEEKNQLRQEEIPFIVRSFADLPKPTDINVFVNHSILGNIPPDSAVFLNLIPDHFNKYSAYFSAYNVNKKELFKSLSYGFQLLGDLLPKESTKDRAISYYKAYLFNPKNKELWNFFIRKKISEPTLETIENQIKLKE